MVDKISQFAVPNEIVNFDGYKFPIHFKQNNYKAKALEAKKIKMNNIIKRFLPLLLEILIHKKKKQRSLMLFVFNLQQNLNFLTTREVSIILVKFYFNIL